MNAVLSSDIYNFVNETKPLLAVEIEAGRECCDPVEFEQLVWAESVNDTVASNDYFGGDDQLVSQLKEVVTACGLTYLKRTHSFYRIHSQATKRLNRLREIAHYHLGPQISFCSKVAAKMSEKFPEFAHHYHVLTSVLSRLVITNSIDHPVKGSTLNRAWNQYVCDCPLRDYSALFRYPERKPAKRDKVTEMVERMQANSRKQLTVQRIHNAMEIAHAKGWYFVFDTLTLDDHRIGDFYDDRCAIRDYCRSVGRLVAQALGRPVKQSTADIYQYICVPEYGGKHGRLHFHLVHLMAELPSHQVDPNFGRPSNARNLQELDTLKGLWPYGFCCPIAVRYQCDAFTVRRGWLWPTQKGRFGVAKAREVKPMVAVAHYVAKYVNKQVEFRLNYSLDDKRDPKQDAVGGEKWRTNYKALIPRDKISQVFRVRMSRGFGMAVPTMQELSLLDLVQMTQLHWSACKLNRLLRENARRELSKRLGILSLGGMAQVEPDQLNLLQALRDSIQPSDRCSQLNSIDTSVPSLTLLDVSNAVRRYLHTNGFNHEEKTRTVVCGSK